MATSKWIYALATGVFSRGGFYEPSFDPATEGVVAFPDADAMPDIRRHRFDPTLGKRLATAEELTAYDTDDADAQSKSLFDGPAGRVIRATVYTALRGRLGRAPTQPEIQAERTIWIAAWKQLG